MKRKFLTQVPSLVKPFLSMSGVKKNGEGVNVEREKKEGERVGGGGGKRKIVPYSFACLGFEGYFFSLGCSELFKFPFLIGTQIRELCSK